MELNVQNKKVEFFNDFDLTLKYDSIGSVFGFKGYFNPNNAEHKQLFKPGQYNPCTVTHGNELLVTGTLLSSAFISKPIKELIAITGYSKTGILEDCDIPTSLFPLQSDGISLKEIAQKLLRKFNINLVIEDHVGSLIVKLDKKIKKSCAKESQNIKSYLTELATQRHIVLTHNEKGDLVFSHPNTKQEPFINYDFSKGMISGTDMALNFNAQAMHSHITVLKQASADSGNAGESTVQNPYVTNIYRPKVVTQSSGDDIDTSAAAKAALAIELKALRVTITTDRWIINNKIIRPNTILTVLNPDLYLFNKTRLFVEEVNFKGDNTKTIATITCVLPEVYNTETPKNIFA